MLHIQEFLLTHSLKDLSDLHGVNSRPSNDGSKWSLNYDQIAAKSGDHLAEQCRGLVIRPVKTIVSDDQVVGETLILARPMDRFYNAGDTHASIVDWNNARIQEKIDGTCCILYFDDVQNRWCVATRAVPEADVTFGDELISPLPKNTFYELFRYSVAMTIMEIYVKPETHEFHDNRQQVVNDTFEIWLDELDKSNTYIYELTSPLNRIVVRYDDYRVTLLSARNTQTGEYVEYSEVGPFSPALQLPQTWNLSNIDELVEFVNASDPAKIEGAVVVDGSYNRLKVKSKAWVLASRAKDMVTMSKRNALEAIIDGTMDDVIPLLDPELVKYVEQMRASLVFNCFNIDSAFLFFSKKQPNRKEFALVVQSSGLWQTPLFNLYSGKFKTTLEWLQFLCKEKKMTASTLDTILEMLK